MAVYDLTTHYYGSTTRHGRITVRNEDTGTVAHTVDTIEEARAAAERLERTHYSAEAIAKREAAAAARKAAQEEQERRERLDLITDRQHAYLTSLIADRWDPAFWMTIPEDLTAITRQHASALIDGLLNYR